MKTFQIEKAGKQHLEQLVLLEQQCFTVDRLSRRSLRRFLTSEKAVFLVATYSGKCVGYVLVIFHQGTQLARLYSIAVDEAFRRQGCGATLMQSAESAAQEREAFYIRLEVAQNNQSAIDFYRYFGYRKFGLINDYYEDHSDALRMQKRIRRAKSTAVKTMLPWYRQQTPFTCGPASLMMAMSGLQKQYIAQISDELQIWREATTIFMTSGHGGCHPVGLAIAAHNRGFKSEIWINQQGPLFIDGVRDADKKQIIEQVHNDFVADAKRLKIPFHNQNIDQATLADACDKGFVPIILISTYRMDRKKAPHWVAVTGYDEGCFYVHDPDPDEKHQDVLDCQFLPIARQDFDRMSIFGSSRLRTAIILSSK
ncbi:GNAT family N-acetyltransferase/peptidase C39 family protein [Neptunicella marina]|uniref:GNAT family N-acetyltransferase/peptidase C39 family protein n=1 Tax=Neptunicella marina TaxID=2125989 RepID=A0A8J6J0F0_9ALTE|nr:GNAT family N-acetyltransferase/peptidase C39 family protein [Neptunicella marina]MBC3767790.1 GNAT family N-acetyltransferase/peptidase C39 family protein [Neptunicella marina]